MGKPDTLLLDGVPPEIIRTAMVLDGRHGHERFGVDRLTAIVMENACDSAHEKECS